MSLSVAAAARTAPSLPAPPLRSGLSLLVYLLLSFGWTWAFLLLVGDAGLFAAAFGPLLGALGGALIEHGRAGPGLLWGRLGPLSVGWGTWLLAVYAAVPAAIMCLLLFGAGDLRETGGTAAILLFMPFLAAFSLLPGPVGEELGWRGVLLPWMLTRWRPLPASLLLGLLWSVWHAPLWWQPEFRLGAPLLLFAPLYTLSLLAMSVIITVIYLRAGGSVVLAAVTHAALNAAVGPFALVHARGHLAGEAVLPVTLMLCITAVVLCLACGAAADRDTPEQ